MHIEVRSDYEASEGETQNWDVGPLTWLPDAFDLPAAIAGTTPAGAVAARFRCELKVDSTPPGWSLVSVAWSPTEAAIEQAIFFNQVPLPLPLVGELLHAGDGVGAVSYAYGYECAEEGAQCRVDFLKPDGSHWIRDVAAAAAEQVLVVGGPLAFGLFNNAQTHPYWDSGWRASEEGGPTNQDSPWYLDHFGDNPWIATPQFGQTPQRGRVLLRFAQPEGGQVSNLNWSFDGKPSISAPWQGPIQQVTPGALAPEIRLGWGTDTDDGTGAISAKVSYRGSYHQAQFAYMDHSETCPPPGKTELSPHYHKFTMHVPASSGDGDFIEQTPTQLAQGQTSYVSGGLYSVKVLDTQGREQMGAIVQERWDYVDGGNHVIDFNNFHVNKKGEIWWMTERLTTGGTKKGHFRWDAIRYLGVPAPFFTETPPALLYIGVHHYYVGTSWCPNLVRVRDPNFPSLWLNKYVADPSDLPPASGIGKFVGSYTVRITTRGSSQQ